MRLRTVTIWTTGLMVVVPMIVPTIWFLFFSGKNFRDANVIDTIISECMLLWCFSGPPLVVSFIIAMILKNNSSSLILLVSTVAYGIWYFYLLHFALTAGYLAVIALAYVGIFSLPVMIPVWIIVLLLNRHYFKMTHNPGTTAFEGGEQTR